MSSIKNRIVRLELGQPSQRQQERLLARIERGRERVKMMGGEIREWSDEQRSLWAGKSIGEIIAAVRANVGASRTGGNAGAEG